MYLHRNGGRLARRILSCALLLAGSASAPAFAQAVSDPTGDFIPSFTGPKNGDLDLTRVQATFDGAKFRLDATTAAPIGTTPTGLYVWGFNRGKGTAGFAAIGATGVLFDSVVIVNPRAGTVTVRDLVSGTGTTLPASAINISGNQISAEMDRSTRGLVLCAAARRAWLHRPRSRTEPGLQILIHRALREGDRRSAHSMTISMDSIGTIGWTAGPSAHQRR